MTASHGRTGADADPSADLAAEQQEPGDDGAEAARLLALPDTPIVAVRTDGRAAFTTGLPADVDPADLVAPVAAGGAVAVALDMDADTEVLVRFGRFQDPRAGIVGAADPRAVLGALGFAQWRARTRFCPQDGTPLQPRADGRVLRCEARGHMQFPRLEPAVIMRVTDVDDRILLGRQPGWPEGRFSVLAGFVDPGESLEAAVVREVQEEVGLTVGQVTYLASQPWPFPSSLMLGFSAVAEHTDVTLDTEIAEARWLGRDELRDAMDAHEVFVPPPLSIAHRLVTGWLGDDRITSWLDQQPR